MTIDFNMHEPNNELRKDSKIKQNKFGTRIMLMHHERGLHTLDRCGFQMNTRRCQLSNWRKQLHKQQHEQPNM